MRTLLLQGLLHQPLTEAGPRVEDVAAVALVEELDLEAQQCLGRSPSIRALDAGSCNGCELEMHALSNAFYDLERFGLKFVASPRHADVLFVTGPVTKNMREALEGPNRPSRPRNGWLQWAIARSTAECLPEVTP